MTILYVYSSVIAKYFAAPILYIMPHQYQNRVYAPGRSKVSVKVAWSKMLVLMKIFCHKEYTCEIQKSYLFLFQSSMKVKVFKM